MKHHELHQFMDLLLDYGWHIENSRSSELLYFFEGEMIWELTNDDYLKTNTLTFFATDAIGQYGTRVKDIVFVTDKVGNQLIFDKNIPEQREFIKNL
ncbi:hypothetical protein [Capnocytophaga cynodegmi]|uniref:hypothetical protein n=1 Tax=Capnocytophaga cynodegmi TaxID=28189 RepID=UPI003857FF9E